MILQQPPHPRGAPALWPRSLNADLTVPADFTYPTHDLVIADGVTLLVETTAEVLVL